MLCYSSASTSVDYKKKNSAIESKRYETPSGDYIRPRHSERQNLEFREKRRGMSVWSRQQFKNQSSDRVKRKNRALRKERLKLLKERKRRPMKINKSPIMHPLGKGNIISMRDVNQFQYRHGRSSKRGLPVTSAGRSTSKNKFLKNKSPSNYNLAGNNSKN